MQKIGDRKLSELITWAFQGMVVLIASWCASELSTVSKSIQQLNTNVAVIFERDLTKSREIEELKVRVRLLEER